MLPQVERDLQPWVCNEDAPDCADVWQANRRIVCLLSELLRLHHAPEALTVVAKCASTLERATEGLAVDGEACTMPQLEVKGHELKYSYCIMCLFSWIEFLVRK